MKRTSLRSFRSVVPFALAVLAGAPASLRAQVDNRHPGTLRGFPDPPLGKAELRQRDRSPTAVAAPVSLTASDGAGLELTSLSAQAVVDDPLAFTELHLIFRNPENRVREGRFRITLPSGATISRFAMRAQGEDRWQEGEVVEQQAARVAYEDFLHRRQDPALLETEAGNEFSARVFPIPPNATKELIVSYSQELRATGEPYRLPLAGLPRLGHLSVRAMVGKAAGTGPASNLGGQRARYEVVEVDKRDFTPDRDFQVAHDGVAGRLGLRNDNLVVARLVPFAAGAARDEVAALSVLIDTSASRALGLDEQVAAVEALVAELRKTGDPTISVAAFDQDVAPLYSGKASAMGHLVRDRILQRRALGASNLQRALEWLASAKERHGRVLLVTDGVATAGETAADKLRARVKALSAAGVQRLDVLAVGGIREDALLARLVTAGLARDGVVLDAAQPAAVVAGRLTRATRSGLKLEIDGAGWVWPSTLDGVQAGDETLVYSDLPAGKPFRVKVDGKPLALTGTLAPVERPLLERAWVRARIARLIEMRDAPEKFPGMERDMAEALKKQAIELSVRYRVLCPFTSLLVLETEQDYARFGIERRALADILTIGPGGVALAHRSDFATTEMAAPMQADAVIERASSGRARLMEDKDEKRKTGGFGLAKKTSAAPSRGVASAREEEKMDSAPALDDGFANLASGAGAPRGEGAGGLAARPAVVALAAPPPPPAPLAAPAAAAAAEPVERRAQPARPSQMHAAKGAAAHRVLDVEDVPVAPPVVARPVPPAPPAVPSLEGALKEVMDAIHRGDARGALAKALAWRARDPGDVLALVALGECWEALGDATQAARAYGSIIDLFPGRADMRRFAGERLERVRGAAALALAVDTYRQAVEQRPDHPASHRLLGFALLKQGHPREAFAALAVGAARRYPEGRFRGVERILAEDLGLAAAAWMRAEPANAADIRARLVRAGGTAETAPSLRFVLNWETDANDVDFHIHDGHGGHAYYASPRLPSGGELYADVTTGYGPECFTIRNPAGTRATPYRLQAHYYSRGPMGYGMGKLQVIEHDGKGGLRFEERPFVIMHDGAFVELGTVQGGGVATAEAQAVRAAMNRPVLAR